MLKFVHTKPPRARSSSPASAASLDHLATAARHRDRSYPPYPPLHPAPRERHYDRSYPPHGPRLAQPSQQERSYSPSSVYQSSHRDRLCFPHPLPPQSSRHLRGEVGSHRPPTPPHQSKTERSGRDSFGVFTRVPSQHVGGPVRPESDYDQLTVLSPQIQGERDSWLVSGSARTPNYSIPSQGYRRFDEGYLRFDTDYSQAEFVRTPVVRDRDRTTGRVLFPSEFQEEHVGRFPVTEDSSAERPQFIRSGQQISVSDKPPLPDLSAAGHHHPLREDVRGLTRPELAEKERHLLSERRSASSLRRYPETERQWSEFYGLQSSPVKYRGVSKQPQVPGIAHPCLQPVQPKEDQPHLSQPGPFHVRDVDPYAFKPGKFPVTDSDWESSRPSSVKERHVRIAPYPAEIYSGSRASPSPVTDRDRSDSSSAKALHSILSKHPRERDHRIVRSPSSSRDEPDGTHPTYSGISEVGQVIKEQIPGAGQSGTWAAAEPSSAGLDSPCCMSSEKKSKKAARGDQKGSSEGDRKGRKAGKGKKKEGDGSGGDKGWKPKLFFSGSWLHGPSRHRIFASKSAQPPPPPVMTTCVPQVSNDLSNEALTRSQTDRSTTQSSQGSRGMMSSIKDMLNRSQDNVEDLYLDLTYITERIISMSFPSEGHDTTYAFNLKDVVRMLKTKHGDNYLVLNLSEKRQDLVKANPQVKDYGWPDHLAPPLERLCSVCKAMDAWLHADPRNVAVLHCKGGRARIAIIIASYMHYSNICASADQALDRFAMKRYYEDKLGGLPLPSQRRYVHYFAGLLSGAIKINSNPLYLHHILIHGVPNFDAQGGCRPFIKVYQGMQPIFTSGVYNVTDNMQKVCISISPGIPLRGDILIKCYHKKGRHGSTGSRGGGGSGGREIIWQCQFHTCAIQDGNIVFSKQELDDGIHDPRFPDNGKVEFVFGPTSDVPVSVSGFKSDVTVPVDDNEDSLTRSDSYENFHRALAAQGLDRYVGPRDISYGSQHQQHQHQSELHSSTFSTQVNSARTNYSTSSVSRSGAPVLEDHFNYNSVPRQQVSVPPQEERSQLDELLSDLLSDQVIVTSPTSPRSPSSPQQNMMKGAKTVTTTTHTYHTFSSTDSHGGGRSPADKVLIQRAEVTYKVPGIGEEKQHYTIAGEPPDLEKPRRPAEDAFSYSSTSSSHVDQSRRFQSLERDMNRSERVINVQQSPPARTQTLPYRADYENRHTVESQQYYNTLDSDQASWLQQQQQKLQRKRDGRDSTGRTEQEKQLVNELKFAQNRYYTQRSASEADEQAAMDSYRQPPLHNGPLSASTMPANYAPPPRGFGGDAGHFSTYSQSQSHFVESHYGDRSSNKPPPSPTLQRSVPPTSMPVQPPARSSSKDYMRTRSHSSSGNVWQTSPPANRPLERQYSETLLDRDHTIGLQAPRRASSSTPPRSPMGPTATTTYTTYRTIHKEVRDDPIAQPQMQPKVAAPPVHAPPPQQPPANQTHHNYITEVFVHRVGDREKPGRDKPDSIDDTRLDELTRSLQAATESLMEDRVSSTQQQKQQQSFQQSSSWQEHYQSVSSMHSQQPEPRGGAYGVGMHSTSESARSRSASSDWDIPPIYVQQQQQQQQKSHKDQGPPPKPVNVVEEDRITLRPIGPGMQTLEPETSHSTSTLNLNRAGTPSFPISPATPPFPVSPRTVHRSTVRSPYIPVFYSRPATPEVRVQRYESSDTLTPVFESTETLTGPTPANVYRISDPLYAALPIPAARRQASSVSSWRQGGTLPSQQQYTQHHQQQYHQQFQQHGQVNDGTLHIDTSQRMLAPSQARSPSSAGSPHSPSNIHTLRQELSTAHTMSGGVVHPQSLTGQSSPSVYFGLSRRGSLSSIADSDMVHATPKFVKDTSKYWYKPNITRDDAIALLRDKPPGTFVIRDSNTFPGAYGLAVKVAQLPPNVQPKPTNDPQAELVRHFLIEPTPKGVRLRGCSNEPVFGSLAALVYQHSITPLALPCKLSLPDIGMDMVDMSGAISPEMMSPTEVNVSPDLLAKGAACNVIFINSVDTESLTGPQAIAKAIQTTIDSQPTLRTTVVHFKVSNQGITLTDNNRKLFFRRHYPVSAVTYCGMDPQDRRWKRDVDNPNLQMDAKIFGFVARKQGGGLDNSCHLFAELDPEQPASAIVNFITKVMIGQIKVKS